MTVELDPYFAEHKVGATSLEEQAWCRWYGEHGYTGAGAIVELGPWLGSLTASYAEGLARNPRIGNNGKFVDVYDLFVWADVFEGWAAGTEHAGRFTNNESFVDYFAAVHREHERFLTLHPADLSTQRWTGAPIECLINDAVKSVAIAENVFRQFIPAVMPGGIVAHQDYLWSNNSFLSVFMYLARESFRLKRTIPNSTMVVFECVAPFDPAGLPPFPADAPFTRELIDAAFAWNHRLLDDIDPRLIDLGHVATLRDYGFPEVAKKLAAARRLELRTDSPAYDFQVDILRSWGYTDILPIPAPISPYRAGAEHGADRILVGRAAVGDPGA